MTTCILVLNVITCTIVGPKLTPAEAAKILAPNQFVYAPTRPPGPTSLVIASSPTAGPFGEFKPFPPRAVEPPWRMVVYTGRRRDDRGRR